MRRPGIAFILRNLRSGFNIKSASTLQVMLPANASRLSLILSQTPWQLSFDNGSQSRSDVWNGAFHSIISVSALFTRFRDGQVCEIDCPFVISEDQCR